MRLVTKITVMVWVDCAYGLIVWRQDNPFGRLTDRAFGNPGFTLLVLAFG